CTTRIYGFSNSTSRTTVAEYASGAEGVCQTTTAAASRTWTYDTADRVNTSGYVYDALGRTTTVPAADTATAPAGNATIAYHSTDLVDTITQGGRTTDYTLDVTGERVRSWTDNTSGTAVQSVHHYDSDSDNPSWTQETDELFTRPVAGLSGMAGIFDSESGQVEWQVANLHGDLIAAIHGDDDGLSRTSEANEYGTPRNAADAGSQRYGWLGAKQRAADTPSGIILMGVRLYNTVTGRFLQVDPVYGGSCNTYEYTCADPINSEDLDGKAKRCSCSAWKEPVKKWIKDRANGLKKLNNRFHNWQVNTAYRVANFGAKWGRKAWNSKWKYTPHGQDYGAPQYGPDHGAGRYGSAGPEYRGT
ncbi:RHS repeat-associated core domain-containing protein, partial [Micromonospora sp. NPDC051296]|uniref:RHS repeat-associated core domain-containing protein n=1 Tax=Micromonospora sp. NPDC051296 TaxID=3155046 RepID=UPI003444C5C6